MSENNQIPRFFHASMGASLATILIPISIGLLVFFDGPSVFQDGTPDNAPHRAAIILLFSIPIAFTLLFAAWYCISKILHSCNILSKSSLLVCCLAGSTIVGSIFAIGGYNSFGLKDAIFSFAIFAFSTFFNLGIGWFTWCFIGFQRHNKAINSDRKTSAV